MIRRLKKISYNGNNPLQGIIYHSIMPKTDASSYLPECYSLYPAANIIMDTGKFWSSDNKQNSWLLYDFSLPIPVLIDVSHYSFKTHNGKHFPTKWELQCSNDNDTWIPIHQSEEDDKFTQSNQIKTFSTTRSSLCRYFRYYDIGPNEHLNNYTNLYAFELFGTIYSYITCSQSQSITVNFKTHIFLLIVFHK